MQRDREYMLDILEAAKTIEEYIQGKTEQDFSKNLQCQDAVLRRLEIIGEAAGRISEKQRNSTPAVPWQDMIAMRNRLIHQYDDIDMAIVWETITRDIPRLVEALNKCP